MPWLRAERDPSADLRGALPPVKQTHYPSITDPEQVAALLRVTVGYPGSLVVPCALRAAEWSEVGLVKAEWRIRAERMRARVQHRCQFRHFRSGRLRRPLQCWHQLLRMRRRSV